MPIQKRFDHERLRGIAERATARAVLPNTQCTYMQQDGGVSRNTPVAFEWQLQVAGRTHRHVVSVTADNSSKKGVPLPESWRTALECTSLDEIADRFAVEQSAKLGIDMSCTILGAAHCTARGGLRIWHHRCAAGIGRGDHQGRTLRKFTRRDDSRWHSIPVRRRSEASARWEERCVNKA